MGAKKKTMAKVERASNDLQEIEGLGPKSAEALVRLGIGNRAELARYLRKHSAQALSDKLAEEGVTVAAKTIENADWLRQARELSARPATKPEKEIQEKAGTGDRQEARDQPADSAIEVLFDVRFRRKGHRWVVKTYDERDGGLREYHGIDPGEWANWILDQMRSDPELEFPRTVHWSSAAPEIEIERLKVEQSLAERFKTLALEVSFEISGSGADMLMAAGTPVWIYVQAHDLASRAWNYVASERLELEPERSAYKERLEFPILELGRYQLHTLVAILPPAGVIAQHQGDAF
ncbi:MAG: hypothetical protein PVH95_06700, partial [Anaerolineae bacterium]